MGNFLDKDGVIRFKTKLLTEVDKRIGASGGGTVTSVDGKTGAVDLSNTYQPKGNYLTSAPVTSVNGSKGDVTINDYVTGITISGKTVTITKKNGTSTTQTTQDTTYTLPTASSSTLGGVKTGSNITNSSGTISLSKTNVTSALGYTPLQTAPVTSVNGKTGAVTIEALSNDEIIEAANRVSDVEVDPSVATVEVLQTGLSRVESNLGAKMDKSTVHLVNSWSDGTNWYRKYSDGFIEQGGNVTGAGDWTSNVVTLPIAFTNTKYCIAVSGISYNGRAESLGALKAKTTSSFTHVFYMSNGINPSWYACGY